MDGLEILPAAIRKSLGDRFVAGCNVLSVKKTDSGFEVIAEPATAASGTELNSVPTPRTKIPSPQGEG